ncbi:DNA-directed RNA polymerase II subunit 4 [Glycine max]|nr:DNA-directed RNA polymerase II subunit 4 [Glycine max]
MRDHTLEELLADIRERKDVVVQQELNLIDDVVIMVKEEAKCLMNCEVALIPEHKVFEKSQQYVKRFSRYKNPDAVRDKILARYQLAEFELCVLGNLCLETVEEAIAMVPSIESRGRAQDDEAIEKMLNDLSLIKKFE